MDAFFILALEEVTNDVYSHLEWFRSYDLNNIKSGRVTTRKKKHVRRRGKKSGELKFAGFSRVAAALVAMGSFIPKCIGNE